MCFGEQFRNWPQKFGLFVRRIGLKRHREGPKKCEAEILFVPLFYIILHQPCSRLLPRFASLQSKPSRERYCNRSPSWKLQPKALSEAVSGQNPPRQNPSGQNPPRTKSLQYTLYFYWQKYILLTVVSE